jgi:hypothetical protein
MALAMVAYRFTYQPLGSDLAIDRTVQAAGLDQAYAAAADLVAEAHDMVGEHVDFDRPTQRVTIGAGYRSRRGTFSLEPAAPGI